MNRSKRRRRRPWWGGGSPTRRSRIFVPAVLVAAVGLVPGLAPLGAAAAAGLRLFGVSGAGGSVVPNCPGSPCVVVTAVTGFQAAIGGRHNTMTVGRAGSVTSWKIVLAAPSAAEAAYFDQLTHGPARAGLVVLRHVAAYGFRLIDSSPVVNLAPLFGRTTTFKLDRALPVRPGDILALTVPTWAPALAAGLDQGTAWRASRSRKACTDVITPTAQLAFGALTQYECVYPTVRLAYGASVTDASVGAPASTPAAPAGAPAAAAPPTYVLAPAPSGSPTQ